MYIKYFRFLVAILFCAITSCSTVREKPRPATSTGKEAKREFRGAWIQTAFQGEYKDMTPARMKKTSSASLITCKHAASTPSSFRCAPRRTPFYKSDIEPWSRFFTGEQGVAPAGEFDPMAFLIQECHKRNMEFHAWLNPYRASTAGNTRFADSHIYHKHPEWFVTYNKQILFDPGLPESRQFICRVVRDIVGRYDVDAIHMDDYFYPYPAAVCLSRMITASGNTACEKDTARRKGTIAPGEREYPDPGIETYHPAHQAWVRFGISPFGIYRNKKSTADGSGSNTNGLQNYDDLYADITYWVQQGWIDYNIPQIYWEIGHPAADYITLIKWWDKNANGGHLYIGQDVARTMKADQLTRKMRYERALPHVSGNCFWPANEILWNNKA